MKHLILIFTLSFSLLSLNSFAEDGKVSKPVLESFNNAFKNATEVNWTTTDNYYKVSFSLNEQYITAYYNAEGQMIALTRNISSTQLPFALQLALKKNFDAFWISDMFEMSDENGISYFTTVENGNSRVILKATAEADWSVYKRSSK